MGLLRCVITITLLFVQVELQATAQPADTSPSHNLVHVEHDFRVIYRDGSGRGRDVTNVASVASSNDHANLSAGRVSGHTLGSSLVVADYRGLKAHSLFHVFEHPIQPLSNRWGTEHDGGYYLTVTPSSITLAEGETRDDFVVTLHSEDGSTDTVAPTRVVACQPNKVTFSGRTATAANAGPAALAFIYRLPAGQGSDLCAVCYVTVISVH
jgi:hypothetical protein